MKIQVSSKRFEGIIVHILRRTLANFGCWRMKWLPENEQLDRKERERESSCRRMNGLRENERDAGQWTVHSLAATLSLSAVEWMANGEWTVHSFSGSYSPYLCRRMNGCQRMNHSFSGSCQSMNGNFGSAKVAEVVIFKIATVPENMYDFTLPQKVWFIIHINFDFLKAGKIYLFLPS